MNNNNSVITNIIGKYGPPTLLNTHKSKEINNVKYLNDW